VYLPLRGRYTHKPKPVELYEDDNRVYAELAEELADGTADCLDANVDWPGRDIATILQAKTQLDLNFVLDRLVASLPGDVPGSSGCRLKVLQQGICSFPSQQGERSSLFER